MSRRSGLTLLEVAARGLGTASPTSGHAASLLASIPLPSSPVAGGSAAAAATAVAGARITCGAAFGLAAKWSAYRLQHTAAAATATMPVIWHQINCRTLLYGSPGARSMARSPWASASAAVASAAPRMFLSPLKGPAAAGLLVTGPRRLLLAAQPVGLAAAAAAALAAAAACGAATQWVPTASTVGAVRCIWRDSRGYEHFHGRGHTWSLQHNRRIWYTAAAMTMAGLSYYLYCLEKVPYTGRFHSIMLVSRRQEQWMGKMGFEQFKAIARAEHKLLPDHHPDVERVRKLGTAIARVAANSSSSSSGSSSGGSVGHMTGLQWEFAVIRDNMVNAAVLPGGKVIVFSGLLRLLDSNDDELAAVLAHEVGHVLARHPAENLSRLNVWLLFNTALRLTLGFALPDVAMYLALMLPNSRRNEHEADVIGLHLMAQACFDPSAAIAMLEKLNQAEKARTQGHAMGASLPPFLSTHPLTTDRVTHLEEKLPAAMSLFYTSGCGTKLEDFGRGVNAFLDGSTRWP